MEKEELKKRWNILEHNLGEQEGMELIGLSIIINMAFVGVEILI